MKKLVLVLLVCILAIGVSNAQQVNQGNFYVSTTATGIDLRFGSGNDLAFGVEGGYFLFNKFAVGANVGLNYFSENGESTTGYNLMGGFRYYFLEKGPGALFAAAYAGMQKFDEATFAIDLRGGYSFFVKDNIAIEPIVDVNIPFKSGHDASFGLGCGFTLFF